MQRRDDVLHFLLCSLALPKLWFPFLTIAVHGAEVSTELSVITAGSHV